MRKRKLTRLKGYDYGQNGYYFVTICTQGRQEYFGEIKDGVMNLNKYGNIVSESWYALPDHYHNIKLDEFIILPNHVHGIVIIDNNVGNGLKPFPTQHGLPEIIRGFKTFSSRRINEIINVNLKFHWQKSFYDRIIRNEKSLDDIRRYIVENSLHWEFDKENPKMGKWGE